MTDIHDLVLSLMQESGIEDGMSIYGEGKEAMFRFSNNRMTVANSIDERSLTVFVRHASGGSSMTLTDVRPANVESAVRRFLRSLQAKGPSETHLPSGPMEYRMTSPPAMEVEGDRLMDIVMDAVDSAKGEGADRVAGTFQTAEGRLSLRSTHGMDAEFTRPSAELSLRAFCGASGSGHGLSVSGTLDDLRPIEAGKEAGKMAKASSSPIECTPGVYDALLAPMVAADIVSQVGSMSSAFYVDAGMSFLAGRCGEKVCSDMLTLVDDPCIPGTLGWRPFDDEGMPTRSNRIVSNGVLQGHLHNTITAAKAGTRTTANAGLVSPRPFNLTVSPGDKEVEDMLSGMDRGIWVTNIWYLRYQNYRTGDFSAIPRDAMFLVEDGEVKGPVRDLRISDNILSMLSKIRSMSKERSWVKWWEVDVPTLCPHILSEGVNFTRSTM